MEAYSKVDQPTRKAMEGLLRTWKLPIPESMDSRPVFSPDVTSDIDKALDKMKSVQAQMQSQRPVHALPARPAVNAAWRHTPTPPQNGAHYGAPADPRARQVNLIIYIYIYDFKTSHLQYHSYRVPSTHSFHSKRQRQINMAKCRSQWTLLI